MDDNSIWYVYERTSNYYHTCKHWKSCRSYKDFQSKICYCYLRKNPVHPYLFAECGYFCGDNKPIMSKRLYIKPGEPCPICIEPILTKKTAWITPCGHIFHKMCLMNFYRFYELNPPSDKYSNTMPCPYCREELVYGCCMGMNNIDYYNSNNNNGIDNLENFWLTIDNRLPLPCYHCDKSLGMNKNCKECISYREIGFT